MSPFVNAKLVMSCSLAPCHIHDAKKGLEEQLNLMLMKYCDPVEGVILAFNAITLLNPYGHIINETPYIHVRVAADALVFRPTPGMQLSAVVNKVGSNHIGLLLAGVFNVSIDSTEMPDGYVHNFQEEAWVGDDGVTIEFGAEVAFHVLRVHQAYGVISIDGSMRPIKKTSTKKRKSIEPAAVVVTEVKKVKKAKKVAQVKNEDDEVPTLKKTKKPKTVVDNNTDDVAVVLKPKKKSKASKTA
ncbi:hypothetical protein SPRG_20002 [Saprolegnia parasitica CBS 223.65]|uniref:RPA43 OB domain-containing protein n=1 Tax=Saprolegnia parasitica (strain CBS 223.65) TaxID=695850 RepID=A0A067CHZ3_SAPPC|nr:hypothetical protein SPRG_20002 [Saprolegnia parasitica CBS 223.65]KDO28795.1 hypothetical protein SPRG_20002 [Saprolegnia parasitica CBS 223.65]|eukprot:XP_012200532.1 hypothetical protein SPRG_20002 [Saprolegnia parasitica CBS 223.65]